MSEQHSKRLIPAQERGSIAVAYSDIFDDNGRLLFLEPAQNRGRVEVRQSPNGIKLSIGGIVGLLPITSDITLNIQPKFPISNLARMVALAEKPLAKFIPFERVYALDTHGSFFPEAILRGFAYYLKDVLRDGLQKSYVREECSMGLRPKINFGQSQKSYWSRGHFFEAVVQRFDFTKNINANSILKSATVLAYKIAKSGKEFDTEKVIFSSALEALKTVRPLPSGHCLDLDFALQQVASFRPAYHRALPLAIEILNRSTVLFDVVHSGTTMPSFLLELEDVFERYIRNTLRVHARQDGNTLSVQDGNGKRWSKKLLDDTRKFDIKPDLLIYSGATTPTIVGDVKYKRSVEDSDRYQVISHTLSYGAKNSLIVCPKKSGDPNGLVKLGTIGKNGSEISLFQYFFDLTNNMEEEDMIFFDSVRSIPEN